MSRTTNPRDLVSSLMRSVATFGPAPLFGTRGSDGWRWMSYAEFARRVDDARGGLARLGVGAADRVAIISRNRVEWAIASYAAMGLSAAFVPMYEAQLERDWQHILRDSGAKVCFVADGAMAARVERLTADFEQPVVLVTIDSPRPEYVSFEQLLADGAESPSPLRPPAPEQTAQFIYTSGTTGKPKGVLLTHANLMSNLVAATAVVPISHEDRTLAFLPWAHAFGGVELNGVIYLGASLAVSSSVDRLADELAEVKPTILFAVPRVWNRIYQGVQKTIAERPKALRRLVEVGLRAQSKAKRGQRLAPTESIALAIAKRLVFAKITARFGGRLRYAVSSAAALSTEVAEFIDNLGIVVLEAYGMTEASPCVTVNRPDNRRIGSVGQTIPGVSIRIDPHAEGAEGDSGEIIIYGPGVMAGYHNLPEETARALTADGGLRSGDLGRVDADGFLYITGRLKELYKLENGKYVAPAPLEERVTLSPYIAQAFVYGAERTHNVALVVPDAAAIEAWAATRGLAGAPDALFASAEVKALLREEIERLGASFRPYERIRDIAIIREPFSTDNGLLTPTLKVKRRAVLARYGGLLDDVYRRAPVGDERRRFAA